MLQRIGVISENTYREAVRARVLHGLFGLALATAAYALIVGQFALRDTLRVVSDLGAASISLYAIIVAIVLGATSLYRELELKTLFPILARPIRRWEYLIGKYLGTVLTLVVFVAANAGALLLALAYLAGRPLALVLTAGIGLSVAFVLLGLKRPRLRTMLPIPWALLILLCGYLLADGAPDDRRVIFGGALLTVCEVCVIAAVAMVFSAFSSPFLTAVLTLSIFIVGRSADTLARLPERVFGETIHTLGVFLSKVVPNLMLYAPPRPLLTGEAPGAGLASYIALAGVQALVWAVLLLSAASLIFRRRDSL